MGSPAFQSTPKQVYDTQVSEKTDFLKVHPFSRQDRLFIQAQQIPWINRSTPWLHYPLLPMDEPSLRYCYCTKCNRSIRYHVNGSGRVISCPSCQNPTKLQTLEERIIGLIKMIPASNGSQGPVAVNPATKSELCPKCGSERGPGTTRCWARGCNHVFPPIQNVDKSSTKTLAGPVPPLIKCRICEQRVSPSAESCPHCGERWPSIDVQCLKCNSSRVTCSVGSHYGFGKAAAGVALLGPLGLLAGLLPTKSAFYRCLDCGCDRIKHK